MATKKKALTQAQIAHQVTWRLQGELKRKQLHFLRIGEQLVRVRDDKLWKALKFGSIESWSQERLGLGRSSLYQYLQVYDWVKERHAEWLRPKPKGFIPELSDVAILRAIEQRLDGRLTPERLKIFEALRKEALAGKLTREEYEAAIGRKQRQPLQAFVARLRALHASTKRVPNLPSDVAADLAAMLARLEALARVSGELARIAPAVRTQLAAFGVRDLASLRV